MHNGKFVGKWIIWDTDGIKHCEVNYDDEGNRHDEQSFFDKDGKIIKVIYWEHGKMIKSKEFIYGTEINYK
jgi:antitoxin component YwqK of YwqJK toxin-antitoxin module